MSQETMDQGTMGQNSMDNMQSTYQDPISTTEGKPADKKVGGSTIAATVVSVLLFRFFGIIGALICYGGYWAIYAVATKTKLPLAAKIIIGILLGFVFLAILFLFILLSGVIQANM